MSITIQDVAEKAGVSHQTVSRVINNSPRVRAETRDKIMSVIKELNYYPNVYARNIQRKQIRSIGFTYPRNQVDFNESQFYSTVLGEVGRICTDEDVTLNLISFDSGRDPIETILKPYHGQLVSGIILTCPSTNEDALFTRMVDEKIPFVVIGRPNIGAAIHYVDNDNVSVSYMMAEHILRGSHRRIALINGPAHMTMCQDYRTGVDMALRRFDLNPACLVEYNTPMAEHEAEEIAGALLREHPDISAVIAINDIVAIGVLRAAKRLGRSVPEDLSVGALNYSKWNDYINRPLTTVDKNNAIIGAEAAQLIIDLLSRPEQSPRNITIPCSLVEGETVRSL